jgi:hypothetical protein
MAIGDIEFPLKRGPKKAITCWASAWTDLLQVGQMTYLFVQIPRDDWAPNLYQRRALIDDALITYGRLFNSGARKGIVNLRPWIDELGPESVALHEEAMRWRDKHVAHRDDNDLEHMIVTVLWQQFGTAKPALRLRLETSTGPDNDLATDLQAMVEMLRNWVWERELWPRQQEWFEALGPTALEGMRRQARPHKDTKTVPQAIRITQDLGSLPTTPTPPYRRLPSGTKRAR